MDEKNQALSLVIGLGTAVAIGNLVRTDKVAANHRDTPVSLFTILRL
jgi:hypothetical protein